MLGTLILLFGLSAPSGCDQAVYPLDADFSKPQRLSRFLAAVDAPSEATPQWVAQQACSGSVARADWLRLRLVGPQPKSPLLLRIPARAIPSVCVHWPLARGYRRACQDRWDVIGAQADYLFEFPAAAIFQDRPVLIQVTDRLLSPTPISLVSEAGQRAAEQSMLLGTGLISGLVGAVVIICLLAWVVVGRIGYLLAASMFLFGGLAWLTLSGRGYSVANPVGFWLSRSGPSLALQLTWLSLFAYTLAYLKIHKQGPSWQRWTLYAAIGINGLVALIAAFNPQLAFVLVTGLLIANTGTVVLIWVAQLVDGSQRARFLLAAFVLTLLAAASAAIGLFSGSDEWLRIASVLMVAGLLVCPMVLVMAIYFRYGRLETERNSAEQALAAEQRLALMRASYCRITGLPRREKLAEWVSRILSEADPNKVRIGLYLVHLDNLYQIRQQHGREVLEKLIRAASERLRAGLDEDQLLGRLEDFELVVVVPTRAHGEAGQARLAQAAGNIRDNIRSPIAVGDITLNLSATVGLAVWPKHGDSFDRLLRRCDSALYEAQRSGDNTFKVFDANAHSERTHEFRRINELKRAMDRDELELFYQPVHDARSNQVTSVEALIRWHHPEDGLLAPGSFVPLAEDTQLIIDLGYWTLHAAAHDLTSFLEQDFRIPIAINVSPRQFAAPGFIGYIRETVYHRTFSADLLRLEITENSLIHNWDRTQFALTDLRNLGISVFIDDFGVGYSSLNYVRSLPIEGLKIDRSFVKNIGQTSQDEAVVNTIVRLAQSLDLKIVAEGVETAYQRDFLRIEGCDALQGHLFSEPLPKSELFEYLLRGRSRQSQLREAL